MNEQEQQGMPLCRNLPSPSSQLRPSSLLHPLSPRPSSLWLRFRNPSPHRLISPRRHPCPPRGPLPGCLSLR